MKKILILLIVITTLCMVGCKNKNPEENFASIIADANSYIASGIMESFHDSGKKENNFIVYYKNPDLIKVVISASDNDNKQVILKNNEGVYILIPAVNKNFKVDSSWPTNASYPYLLQSLVKDIANDKNITKTENENYITIETTSKMFADANATKQKIIIDKHTNLPTEVLVYDGNGNLYIRCVFTDIKLDCNINDDEFNVTPSVSSLRGEVLSEFRNRELLVPSYIPTGYSISKNDTLVVGENNDITAIYKFTGEDSFTVIQEYVNDSEVMSTSPVSGEIITVLGQIGIYNNSFIEVYYEGVNYTVASSGIYFDELFKIVSSYIVDDEK